MVPQIVIQDDLCHGCGNCTEACPVTTLRKIEFSDTRDESLRKPILQIERGSAKLVDKDACGLCGICVGACPNGAISIGEVET